VADEGGKELEQRKAVLRRFRELIVQQREKFEKYLTVLDHEKTDIQSGDIDKLVSHVELEQQIVSEIYTFQKVIDPLEDLYRASYAQNGGQVSAPGAEGAAGNGGKAAEQPAAAELAELKNSLGALQTEVLARNAENRELLKQQMELLRRQIDEVHRNTAGRRSIYADSDGGSVLDVKG